MLRHGPQINEQLHKIVGQPQPWTTMSTTHQSSNVASGNDEEFVKRISESGIDMAQKTITSPESMSPSTPSTTEYVSTTSDLVPSFPLADIVEPTEGVIHKLEEDVAEPFLAASSALPFKRPEIEFEIRLAGIELNVQLLPSLKAKYKMESAMSSGKRYNFVC